MESNYTYSHYSKSKTPSPSPSTSGSHSESSITRPEVEKESTHHITKIQNEPNLSPSDHPEVQNLVENLQGISLSQEESEFSQGIVTSYLTLNKRLTRAQSENLGIPLVEFPLPSRNKAKKSSTESQSEILSSSSSNVSSIS